MRERGCCSRHVVSMATKKRTNRDFDQLVRDARQMARQRAEVAETLGDFYEGEASVTEDGIIEIKIRKGKPRVTTAEIFIKEQEFVIFRSFGIELLPSKRVVEKTIEGYNNLKLVTDSDEALELVAQKFGVAVHDARVALSELASRRPSRLTWGARDGADFNLSPPEFIVKQYQPEIAAGTLHRGVIARDDPDLLTMFDRWVRVHGKPMEVELPTKREWETRQRGVPKEAIDHYKTAKAEATQRETTVSTAAENRATCRRQSGAVQRGVFCGRAGVSALARALPI